MRGRRVFFAVLAVSVGLACLMGASASRGRASPAWTLRVAQTGASPIASIGSIDPAQALGFFSTQLLWSTCAFLYDYPDALAPSGGALRPEVATAFPTVHRSGRNYTYTIQVRSGYRFQNGRPVTAADFVYDINRARNPSLGAIGPGVLRDLVHAVSHRSTIAITMDRPAPDLPAMLSSTLFCALPAGLPAVPNQSAPMAGPYYIASNTPTEIVLKRNPILRWGSSSERL